MPMRKKVCFNQKFAPPYYSSGNSPTQFSLNYLTRITFCESVLGVSHMLYAEDLAHFGQKEQLKIKMKLKQKKAA